MRHSNGSEAMKYHCIESQERTQGLNIETHLATAASALGQLVWCEIRKDPDYDFGGEALEKIL